jgi:Polysaccharide lyase
VASITSSNSLAARLLGVAAAAIAALTIVFAVAVPAEAGAQTDAAQATQSRAAGAQRQGGKSARARARKQAQRRRHARARARRAHRRAMRAAGVSRGAVVSRARVVKAASSGSSSGVLDASFENGLSNWNTAGVGEATPTVVNDIVRNGAWSGKVALTGSQDRSELILGGNGGGSTNGMVEFHEGDEYFYGFSFYIESMVYGEPGAHNLIMQFKGDDDGSPAFGLQLWDYQGDDGEYAGNPKGLWSHGPSMDGDRFLAPVVEHAWHDVVIHFKASGSGNGFYELYLDGRLIDSRSGVSMIADGANYAYIKDGLYRNGGEIPGTSEIRLDAARLGHSLADVTA